jgi:class 3 adenylate cyclase
LSDTGRLLYGGVPNTAARVQAFAEPSSVLIIAQVQRQFASLFVVVAAIKLKGMAELVTIFP